MVVGATGDASRKVFCWREQREWQGQQDSSGWRKLYWYHSVAPDEEQRAPLFSWIAMLNLAQATSRVPCPFSSSNQGSLMWPTSIAELGLVGVVGVILWRFLY